MWQSPAVPLVTLNNGHSIPIIGLGTWLSQTNEVKNAVKVALEAGYRHFDCAYIYANETEIGLSLHEAFDNGLKREEIFITSKLWNTFHEKDDVKKGCEASLKALGLDYLDLYLIHSPMAIKPNPEHPHAPPQASDYDYLDTWKAMEELVDQGLVKSIGVSNFNSSQIKRILENCRIKPAMNQIEIHPRFTNVKLVEFCQSNGIAVTAYFSLGNDAIPERIATKTWSLLDDPRVKRIADKYGKTPAQVLLRWAIDREFV